MIQNQVLQCEFVCNSLIFVSPYILVSTFVWLKTKHFSALTFYKKRWAEHVNKDFIDFISYPTIWIREIGTKKNFMVIGMDEDSITIIDSREECVGEMIFGSSNATRTVLTPVKIDMPMLASRFTFLDGSGCIIATRL